MKFAIWILCVLTLAKAENSTGKQKVEPKTEVSYPWALGLNETSIMGRSYKNCLDYKCAKLCNYYNKNNTGHCSKGYCPLHRCFCVCYKK